GADGWFRFSGIPEGEKVLELWLPQFGDFRLSELYVARDSQVWRPQRPARRRLLAYGSSITHCRAAASPTRTWPALVARALDAELTCLGFGGQCHLDPMVARVIRDRPADLILTCLGINVYGNGSFNSRSFRPAVLGFLSTIRDGHPDDPIVVLSPIASPARENTVGGADLTLAEVRADVHGAVQILQDHGDRRLHVIDGRSLLGPEQADRLSDGLHPDAEGYELMARSLTASLDRLGLR
ncbi:MAG TPA: SGNH/GDSL hydrolase family protein, partial [Mycobacteriales bacterium]|nr:SGNH/GDSL hydrolase family protein [Mycobacteriales bacterium]